MKIFFYSILILLLNTSHLMANINPIQEDQQENITEEDQELVISTNLEDINFKNFSDEMSFLENQTNHLNAKLEEQEAPLDSEKTKESDDTEEVSITHSSIHREPAVLPPNQDEDIELSELLNGDKSPPHVRRVRSR